MNYAAYKFSGGQFPAVQNYFQFQKTVQMSLPQYMIQRFISAFHLQESRSLNCSATLHLYKGA